VVAVVAAVGQAKQVNLAVLAVADAMELVLEVLAHLVKVMLAEQGLLNLALMALAVAVAHLRLAHLEQLP
jgi:hypothetical protein